jgi:tRNA nucleotidyltransferase/poly(A) polymerase
VRDELLGRPAKDQDFVVPGVGYDELRDALAPYGRVEDLEVAGRRVGLRLYPNDRALRSLAPAGIEFAPPRTERSTGPGRHDFEIVASPEISLEQDMARRDFTINAIAKRLETGELLDPFNGRDDLDARVLRTVSPESFREDPLRLVRGLRFVSEHDLDPDEQTLGQMRENAESVRLVSAERIGGGLSADGMGELSKLLLGAYPAKALRLAVETGVFAELLPELEPDDFAVVQASAAAGDPLAVRLGALLRGLDAETTRAVLRRLRYPTQLVRRVGAAVEGRPDTVPDAEPLAARRTLARYGEVTALDVARLRLAAGDDSTAAWLHALEQASDAPHRISDLAINGGDLRELGFAEGPRVGEVLAKLLERVVDDPTLNTRDRLIELAKELG